MEIPLGYSWWSSLPEPSGPTKSLLATEFLSPFTAASCQKREWQELPVGTQVTNVRKILKVPDATVPMNLMFRPFVGPRGGPYKIDLYAVHVP